MQRFHINAGSIKKLKVRMFDEQVDEEEGAILAETRIWSLG